jgi:hypothetical protein
MTKPPVTVAQSKPAEENAAAESSGGEQGGASASEGGKSPLKKPLGLSLRKPSTEAKPAPTPKTPIEEAIELALASASTAVDSAQEIQRLRNEVQTIAVLGQSPLVVSGSFVVGMDTTGCATCTVRGAYTSARIPVTADAIAVKTALENMPNVGTVSVGSMSDVCQVERRFEKRQPFGERLDGRKPGLKPLGVLGSEASMPDYFGFNARQPGKLPVEQYGRRHLDVGDECFERGRVPQCFDDARHDECRLSGPGCPAE